MDKAELIRHEIEKRRDHNLAIGNPLFTAMAEEDIELLLFIDSMQEEPVSEDLKEAAHKYADGENPTCPCEECLIKTFKAGAKWQHNFIWHDVRKPIEINRLIIFTRSGKVLPETGRYIGLGGNSHGDFFEILQKNLQHDLIYDMESWCYISDILPTKD